MALKNLPQTPYKTFYNEDIALPSTIMGYDIDAASYWADKYTLTTQVGAVGRSSYGGNERWYVALYKRTAVEGNTIGTIQPGYVWSGFYYRSPESDEVDDNGQRLFIPYNAEKHGYADVREELIDITRNVRPPAAANTALVSARTLGAYGSADAVEGRVVSANQISINNMLREIASKKLNEEYQRDREFELRTRTYLKKWGYSDLEIAAFLRADGARELDFVQKSASARIKQALINLKGTQGSGGPGGSSPGSRSSNRNGSNTAANFVPVSSPNITTKLVVRMPSGYRVPDQALIDSISRPAIYQTFINDQGEAESYIYTFDNIPQSIQYSGLGSEWVEIPRAENYAFVDWSRYQLMKVSMSWIVARDRSEVNGAIVHDGLTESVDDNLMGLRKMAQNKHPITIVNMDDLLSVKLTVTNGEDGELRSVRGMQFVISDLSITASRRTADLASGQPTSPSKIALAQVQMTLQEVPIESVQIATFPSIEIPFTPPKGKNNSANPLENNYKLFTDGFTAAPSKAGLQEPPE